MNKLVTNKKYLQHGGVPTLIALIGQFIATIVTVVLEGVKNGAISTMEIHPNDDWYDFKNWTFGYLWKYLWWSLKSCFYLLIFCFGGPLIILFGIILLYKNLGNKLTQRADYEEEKKNNNAGVNSKNNSSK